MSRKPVVVLVTVQGAQPFAPNGKGECKLFDKVLKGCVTNFMGEKTAHFIDMHNVMDLFHPDDSPFDPLTGLKVCISWVGNVTGTTANKMVPDMVERIKQKQLHFGLICSARGKKPRRRKGEPSGREAQGPEIRGRALCVDTYSKAGLIKTMLSFLNCEEVHFYDDAADHCASVDSLAIPFLKVHHITRENTPEKVCKALELRAKKLETAKLEKEGKDVGETGEGDYRTSDGINGEGEGKGGEK